MFDLDTNTVVHADGTTTTTYLPAILSGGWSELEETFGDFLEKEVDGWKALTGWTGQHAAADSALMHASEYVGAAMERHMLERPGEWAVVALLDDEQGDYWAVFHRPAK